MSEETLQHGEVLREPKYVRGPATYALATILVLFGAGCLFASLQIRTFSGASWFTAATFPIAASLALMILAVLLYFFPTELDEFPGRRRLLKVAICAALVFGYVAVLPMFGFIIPTVVFLAAMLLFSGERRWAVLGLLPPIAAIVLFIIFYSLLGVSLPAGALELGIHRLIP